MWSCFANHMWSFLSTLTFFSWSLELKPGMNEMPLQAHHTSHSKVISIFILHVGNLREVRRLAGEVAIESLD